METQAPARANVEEAIPFFMVASMESSLAFYRDALGFSMTHSWTPEGNHVEWCNLRRGGASLMLQEYRKHKLPEGRRGEGVSVCFICEDALELYREFTSKGINMREPFVGNGMWVVMLTDPDGYSLCFESFTDVPEETSYHSWKNKNAS